VLLASQTIALAVLGIIAVVVGTQPILHGGVNRLFEQADTTTVVTYLAGIAYLAVCIIVLAIARAFDP
jgi:hypothetical protein